MRKIICIDEDSNITNSLVANFRLIIPTLNRPNELLSNFKKVLIDINRINFSFEVQILISENFSDPEKQIDFSKLKNIFAKHNSLNNLSVIFIQRKTRLSLGCHMHWLGNFSGAEWVMWLGDDDVLSPTYFKFVFDNLENEILMAFAPDYRAVEAKTFFEICDKIERFENPIFERYSQKNMNALIVHRGHQLSGLTYRKKIIESGNNNLPEKNLYPWIAYQIISLINGDIYVLNGNHARITNDTPKLFSYGKDGLFPEICESIIAGFHDNYNRAVYYAIMILGRRDGYFRIFMTSRFRIVSFFWFLAMVFDPRMDKIVLLGLSPIVFFHVCVSQINQIKRAVNNRLRSCLLQK